MNELEVESYLTKLKGANNFDHDFILRKPIFYYSEFFL